MNNTIVALSTPVGRSAIAVIRMSGEDSIKIASNIFSPMPDRPNLLQVGKLTTPHFTEQAMCVWFAAPHSYTGENTVEFHCHGGTAVVSAVIDECLKNGAVPAQNGEFSKRAFINGKQNLTNAEGIIEMIEAETLSAAKAGSNLMENKLGKTIDAIQDELTDMISAAEAALDYPEEDIELPAIDKIKSDLLSLIERTERIYNTSSLGKIAKYGIDVAIVGAPNVGKSSLLNALLGSDRAIVSSHAGTTRDTLSESVFYRDIKFNFVDTAGIRDSFDEVEAEGIRRAKIAADKADVILYVTDRPDDESTFISDKPVLKLFNKCDLYSAKDYNTQEMHISAKNGEVETLKQRLYEMFGAGEISSADLLITNQRQKDCLKRAADLLKEAYGETERSTLDCISSLLRHAWSVFGEITGTTASEEIIDRIYSKFCLGK